VHTLFVHTFALVHAIIVCLTRPFLFSYFQVKAANVPLVIDADGLWHLIHSPSLIKGYTKAVLTPNAMEFCRLGQIVLKRPDMKPDNDPTPEIVSEVARALGGVTIVHKGSVDVISNGRHTEKCLDEGCPRRYWLNCIFCCL
jgi:ATP-dependent NAD(P)H-hydrate dehydratase